MINLCRKIGVIAQQTQRAAVAEFFELFKVPWEFYHEKGDYEVVLSSRSDRTVPRAKLLVIFHDKGADRFLKGQSSGESESGGVLVQCKDSLFPVYTGLSFFLPHASSFMRIAGGDEIVGTVETNSGQRVLHVGYNLFDEVEFLVSRGQPLEHSATPTLDIHIALIRDWIVDSGLAVVEIPPSPAGFRFIVCVTHDVDFLRLQDHGFDKSVAGYAIRSLIPLYIRNCRSKIEWKRILKNWISVLSLPAVFLHLVPDPWLDVDQYAEIDGSVPATFFYIPFKNDPGRAIDVNNVARRSRAACYDIHAYKDIIVKTLARGNEIGLHGIDAWCDPKRGLKELAVIRDVAGINEVGVRMHWLYFGEPSPRVLDEAGFLYDSTSGYNEAIGYRAGTTQPFCFLSARTLWELPMHVMDTAMFYRSRMGLSESEALRRCTRMISDFGTYGGVFTINWHTRSLRPERNWGGFYVELLKLLKGEGVWFAACSDAVRWFNKRRSAQVVELSSEGSRVQLKLSSIVDEKTPDLLVRISYVKDDSEIHSAGSNRPVVLSEKAWSGQTEIEMVV